MNPQNALQQSKGINVPSKPEEGSNGQKSRLKQPCSEHLEKYSCWPWSWTHNGSHGEELHNILTGRYSKRILLCPACNFYLVPKSSPSDDLIAKWKQTSGPMKR